jgi:hypothetical protein
VIRYLDHVFLFKKRGIDMRGLERSLLMGLIVVVCLGLTACRVSEPPTADMPEKILEAPPQADENSAPSRPPETIAINTPVNMQEVSGGVLEVTGYSEYFFEASLGLALCGEGGSGAPHVACGTVDNVLAEGAAQIDSPDMGQSGPFHGSLSYQVTQPVQARLVVYSLSPRDGSI